MRVCPPERELERLLANQMSVAEEAGLEAHVAGCAACQARLDRLTGGQLLSPAPQGGTLPDREDTPARPGVLERVANLPSTQVRALQEEHALERSGGIDTAARAAGSRFTVLRPHAEGGLGRVHLARDEQLRRTVALKEIRPERANDPRLRQRFLNEAEITGQLEHPGIVPIYALEQDDAGRPVYAMRFIQGRTLSEAIEALHRRPTALGLRELLQRFISVCQTVAYAHSKGVIHRDLKPDNVMLGDYGETLVVDWGLAKRLGGHADPCLVSWGPGEPGREEADGLPEEVAATVLGPTRTGPASGSAQLTQAGQVLGTPAYMAPEQARGEVLGPAADVHALGAVLFTLLTGKVPYQGTTSLEVLRKVAAGEPPDAAGGPAALQAICSRAMARDPQARYPTAAELARDVERWLADEPVAAYLEPWPARAGRWARRHRTVVTSLAVAALLLLVTGVGIAWWQNRLAQERRLEQERNAQQVEDLLDRCEAAIAADDAAAAQLAAGDAEKRAEDALNRRLTRCRSAVDVLVELNRIDELRWATEDGKFQGNERALREWPRAFARLGVVPGQTPPGEAAAVVKDSLARERLLAALDLWLIVAPSQDRAPLASLLAAADGDPFRNALRAAVRKADWEQLKSLAARKEALRQPTRFAAALGSIPALPLPPRLAVLRMAAHERPGAFDVLMTAGGLYPINTPTTAAERLPWFRAAVSVRPDSAVARYNLGIALQDGGDTEGAIAEFRTAIRLDPKSAMAHNNLGVALTANKDVDGAMAEYRIALALDPKSLRAHNNLGNALQTRGDLDGAIAEYRTAIALDPKVASPHNNLALALHTKGDGKGAIAELRTVVALQPKSALAHEYLGNALKYWGDLDGAIAAYRKAIQLGRKDAAARQRLAEVERWRALLPRLDRVTAGKPPPVSAAEAAEFSNLARQPFLKRYAASARLYARACAADRKYAEHASHSGRRSNAARAAVLAGCGEGADAPAEDAARAALREQALAWLKADCKHLARRLDSGTAGDRKSVANRLSAWLTEKDLAGVRPGAARAGWSRAEAAEWDGFWSDVRSRLARARQAPGQ